MCRELTNSRTQANSSSLPWPERSGRRSSTASAEHSSSLREPWWPNQERLRLKGCGGAEGVEILNAGGSLRCCGKTPEREPP